jgi:Family of unknown function (DUF6353)
MLNVGSLGQTVNKLKFLLNDNSTLILTGVGVVGTVGTAVLTGRASFKAAEIIAEEEKNLPEVFTLVELDQGNAETISSKGKFSKTEKVKLVWFHFIPPAAIGITTVTSIVLANRISSKQIAALAVAGGISERALQEYKEKVVEKLGIRQNDAIHDEIAQDKVNKTPSSSQVIIAGSGDVLCFEPLTGRYFNSTIETVKKAENKVNYDIIHFDSCSLSVFFEEIGLAPTDYSDLVGWNVSNRMEVRFTTTMSEDNRPCLVIGFTNIPSMDYDKAWT